MKNKIGKFSTGVKTSQAPPLRSGGGGYANRSNEFGAFIDPASADSRQKPKPSTNGAAPDPKVHRAMGGRSR